MLMKFANLSSGEDSFKGRRRSDFELQRDQNVFLTICRVFGVVSGSIRSETIEITSYKTREFLENVKKSSTF